MKAILITLVFLFCFVAQALGVCENYAKYYAIKDYKIRVGTVQGSEGIQYDSSLISTSGNEYLYNVNIHDNNEDGEYWTVAYKVKVKANTNGRSCTLRDLVVTDLQ